MGAAAELKRRFQIRGAYSHYDEEGDVLYVHFGEKDSTHSIEVADDILVDLDELDSPSGLTILNFKQRLKESTAKA